MSKYYEFFKIDLIEGFHHRGAALARIGFYGGILFIFASLWKVTGKTSEMGFSPKMLVWYLGLTELLVLTYPFVHLEIEEDVRTGNLAYALMRPASYFWSRYFRAMGALCARATILGLGGGALVVLFSGGWPDHPWGLLMFPPLAVASVGVGLVFQISVGICAFWVQESSPLYWIWQKMLFILGGLILPLEIYPDWLRNAALLTPFPYMLNQPVKAVLNADAQLAARCLFVLAVWMVAALLLAAMLFARARKGLELNGG